MPLIREATDILNGAATKKSSAAFRMSTTPATWSMRAGPRRHPGSSLERVGFCAGRPAGMSPARYEALDALCAHLSSLYNCKVLARDTLTTLNWLAEQPDPDALTCLQQAEPSGPRRRSALSRDEEAHRLVSALIRAAT